MGRVDKQERFGSSRLKRRGLGGVDKKGEVWVGSTKRGGLGGVDKQEVWVGSTKKGRFGSGRQKGEVWLGSRDELNILDPSLLNPFVEIRIAMIFRSKRS